MNFAFANTELPARLNPGPPISDDELLRFCRENEPLRVERDKNGELIIMSPTWSETSSKNSYINYQLMKWAEEMNSGIVFDSNGGFILPDGSMRAADAAWISWRRWNGLADADRKGFAKTCPQFVIELRSSSDRLTDAQEKMEQWIANGAEVAWLIDPIDRAVTIYRPGTESEHHANPSSVQGTGPIAGFELVLARVWG